MYSRGRLRSPDWTCKECNGKIFGSKFQCNKCNIDKNGNKVAKTKQGKPGDWTCKGCNGLIFASKSKCFKCNMDKNGKVTQVKKEGDWNCKGCNDLMFAKRIKCSKCNLNKLGDIVEGKNTDNISDDKLCIICCTQEKNTLFAHGNTYHMCACYSCAMALKSKSNKCPICMQKIDSVVKGFN